MLRVFFVPTFQFLFIDSYTIVFLHLCTSMCFCLLLCILTKGPYTSFSGAMHDGVCHYNFMFATSMSCIILDYNRILHLGGNMLSCFFFFFHGLCTLETTFYTGMRLMFPCHSFPLMDMLPSLLGYCFVIFMANSW